MFDFIGVKLKILAKVIFVNLTILGLIFGFVIMVQNSNLILIGLLVILVSPLLAWLSSCLLYGFGELIDKTTEIARNTGNKSTKVFQNDKAGSEKTTNNAGAYKDSEKNRPLSVYECNAFAISDETAIGTCLMCGKASQLLRRCKIANSAGIRNIPICSECIELFESNCAK